MNRIFLHHRALTTSAKPSFDVFTNPFKAKRLWPPDFATLSQKHQFRLERRYRRRAKLKWARPTWTKAVKLAQGASIVFVVVYGVLFMDWDREETPFAGIRQWYHDNMDSLWTTRRPSFEIPVTTSAPSSSKQP